MYDVIYFNVWSDIICTAAILLHGTSAFSQKSECFFLNVLTFTSVYQTGKNGILVFLPPQRETGRRFSSQL